MTTWWPLLDHYQTTTRPLLDHYYSHWNYPRFYMHLWCRFYAANIWANDGRLCGTIIDVIRNWSVIYLHRHWPQQKQYEKKNLQKLWRESKNGKYACNLREWDDWIHLILLSWQVSHRSTGLSLIKKRGRARTWGDYLLLCCKTRGGVLSWDDHGMQVSLPK